MKNRIGKPLLATALCAALLFGCLPAAAAGKPAQPTWTLVEQIGGASRALLLDGSTLYVGVGRHVLVMDVTDPAHIQVVGQSPLLPQIVEALQRDGQGRLLVCCGDAGLVLLDMAQPAALPVLGRLKTRGLCENVTMYGAFALIADGPQGLLLADIRDPAAPALVAQAYPLAYAYDVAVAGSTAYLAAGGSGILAVDLTDPLAPRELGLTTVAGFQYDVAVKENRLYAASAWGGVNAFTLADPAAPEPVLAVATPGWAFALAPWGDEWLVMDGGNGALLYDLDNNHTEPRASLLTGGIVVAGAAGTDTAFTLDNALGLVAFSHPKPALLQFIASWSPLFDAQDALLDGDALYVAGGQSGMHTYDIRDLNAIRETACFDPRNGAYATDVSDLYGDLYVGETAGSDYWGYCLSTADPLAPVVLSPLRPMSEAPAIKTDGPRRYAYRYETALKMLDITDPANIYEVASFDFSYLHSFAARDSLLAVNAKDKLSLYTTDDQPHLRQLGEIQVSGMASFLAFVDDHTLLTNVGDGLMVYDISHPETPVNIGKLKLNGALTDAYIDGETAYVSAVGYGVYEVDVGDPYNPRRIDTVPTDFESNACAAQGDLLAVADTFGGLALYQRGGGALAMAGGGFAPYPLLMNHTKPQVDKFTAPLDYTRATDGPRVTVTSAADSGAGTLRAALTRVRKDTTITFDPAVFPPDAPQRILLQTPLPEVECHGLTLDASNAGVVLDGSALAEGDGLYLRGSGNTVMGLQILSFPRDGLHMEGECNRVGGNRNVGEGPVGQGNVCSGNARYGVFLTGGGFTVSGNIVGADVTGTSAMGNGDIGLLMDCPYSTVGGVEPGEGNLLCANDPNMQGAGQYTRIIGNIFGLDITGTRPIGIDQWVNLELVNGDMNVTVGGTTFAERNIIAGSTIGVEMRGSLTCQNAVIGNYIGTDITGNVALSSSNDWINGIHVESANFNRIGGQAAGEGNLISGHGRGICLDGYGDDDNLILGNRLGVNAGGTSLLPNRTGIDCASGLHRGVIGGWTAAEGNLIAGGTNAIRASELGIMNFYIAGNTIRRGDGNGIYMARRASGNFIQCNAFDSARNQIVRIDSGNGNQIRANIFTGSPGEQIFLNRQGNGNISPPKGVKAKGDTVTGKTYPNAVVEVYRYEAAGKALTPLGTAFADAKGAFAYVSPQLLKGMTIALLTTDTAGNTSEFGRLVKVR